MCNKRGNFSSLKGCSRTPDNGVEYLSCPKEKFCGSPFRSVNYEINQFSINHKKFKLGSICVYRLNFSVDAVPGDLIEAFLTRISNVVVYQATGKYEIKGHEVN